MTENYQPEILFEDNHILVVMKEQNLASCPDESGDENLLDLLKDYLKRTYDKPGNVYLGLVQRLSEQMKTGDFEKRYLTVLNGAPNPESGKLVNYLKKNTINNMVYLSTEGTDGAKYAALDYRVLDKKGALALTEVKLHTGRSHQIRVQFAGIAHPVYGDMRYGGEFAIKGRLALWAYSLAFTHPVTKERMRFLSEPPADETPWKFFSLSDFVKPV